MKIEIIEDCIEKIEEPNHVSIIELIVDAVRTYPLHELNDTEDYFNEIKKLLNTNEITLSTLKSYLENISDQDDERTIWVADSLSSLIESFELMQLYNIPFNEVIRKMESLN
ncbi:hypothetical protein MM239_20565 [Belliella sp. DSM 111904]|uniref:Uncharacterized protein n=1 Tax=Belliella filtrata TaxID=2923435 RepID=A0ABS9V5U9_9BACT|nr:hypothetical protein [Belliella filtrata]MCH7411792.1 hypothetical protein [Belliella filtrata]